MKYAIIICVLATNAFAAGWDERINEYCGQRVPFDVAFVSDNGTVLKVGKWPKNWLEEPTIAQLEAQDPAIAAKKTAAAKALTDAAALKTNIAAQAVAVAVAVDAGDTKTKPTTDTYQLIAYLQEALAKEIAARKALDERLKALEKP